MALRDRFSHIPKPATHTVATLATFNIDIRPTVAKIATVTVAKPPKVKNEMKVLTELMGRVKPEMEQNKQKGKAVLRTNPGQVSPLAVAWLRSNKTALQQGGWTAPEQYRRNKSRGIAWLRLWGKPSLVAYLEPGGLIRFEFIDDIGRGVTQTARPIKKTR